MNVLMFFVISFFYIFFAYKLIRFVKYYKSMSLITNFFS
jgi:hypothetical protein